MRLVARRLHAAVAAVVVAVGLAVLVIASYPATAQAGVWTPELGEYYAKVWLLNVSGNRMFTASGGHADTARYMNVSLNYYAEFGLSDGFALVTHGLPAGFASYDGGESTPVVGPLSIGLRRSLYEERLALALEARYGVHTGIGDEDLTPPGTPFAYRPAMTAHQMEADLQLGVPFRIGWFSATAGGHYDTADSTDPAIIGMTQIGFSTGSWWTVDLHSPFYFPLGEVNTINVAGVGQTRYLGFGAGFSWWLRDRWGLYGAIEGVAFAESNASTPSILVGFETRSEP